MKKILKLLIFIFSLLLFKFLTTFIINEIIINNYKVDIYNSKLVKLLYIFNINESYIAYYNEGNIFYKKGEYDKAITNYDESLEHNPPQNRVCDIRINKSLAMVYKINSNDRDTIYNELEKAKRNLYNNGCANENDDNGYSSVAEKLEDEIKKLQDELDESTDDSSDDSSDSSGDSNSTPDVEDIIKEREKEANTSRQGDIANSEYIGNYEYYSGKRW